MLKIYRLDKSGSERRNPHTPYATLRLPANIPYVVDNLWEWVRPDRFPSRRTSVFACPRAELVPKTGNVSGYEVFEVSNLVNANAVQIPQVDARHHPDVGTLHKILVQLLTVEWFTIKPLVDRQAIAPLWMPGMTREDMERVMQHTELVSIKDKLASSITLWHDAKPVSFEQAQSYPYPDGEIFFSASEWTLLPLGTR